MPIRAFVRGSFVFCISLSTACSGGNSAPPPASCGTPPPVPVPFLALAMPADGATGVTTNLGYVLLTGLDAGGLGATTIELSSPAVSSIPIGAPTLITYVPVTTGVPVPATTPTGTTYVKVDVPTLSPATTYSMTLHYLDFSQAQPCREAVTAAIGSFRTQ